MLGIRNDASEKYNISAIMGSLNNAQDFRAYYLNFTQQVRSKARERGYLGRSVQGLGCALSLRAPRSCTGPLPALGTPVTWYPRPFRSCTGVLPRSITVFKARCGRPGP